MTSAQTVATQISEQRRGVPTGLLSRGWTWIQERKAARSGTRRLRVVETVSLGEKRLVALVEVDGLQFLVGGGPTGVVLLSKLEKFDDVLREALESVEQHADSSAAKFAGHGRSERQAEKPQ